MIIENINLSLGITARDIVRYLKERLLFHGERGELNIMDVDLDPFQKPNGNCVSV